MYATYPFPHIPLFDPAEFAHNERRVDSDSLVGMGERGGGKENEQQPTKVHHARWTHKFVINLRARVARFV